MRLLETSKFKKLRKKIKESREREALREAIIKVLENPEAGKRLKGEFRDLRCVKYSVKGQSRRLIYKAEKETIILLSFNAFPIVQE